MSATSPAASWRHEFADANGIRFHYVTEGSGPLVLLLHGFPQFWYAWRHQIPALATKFKVVAPDLRGYGDTEKPPRVADYRTDVMVRDVVELVHALGERKARLVAHDWGGGIAWFTALEHPEVVERLAVLNCPHPVAFNKTIRSSWRQMLRSWYMLFFQIPRLPEWLLTRRDGVELGRALVRSSRRGVFGDEDLAQYRRAIQKPGAATAALNYYRAAFRNRSAMLALEKEGRKIPVPTFLIWAEDDIALTKELTYGMEPYFSAPFRIHYVAGCSHWVNEEEPELVNRLLLEFLS